MLGIILGLLSALQARAADPEVLVSGADSLSLWVRLDWSDPLPGFVEGRLERGIPATVGVRVELWRNRSGWFDAHLATAGAELKVIRDSWRQSYLLASPDTTRAVSGLAGLRRELSQWVLRIPLDEDWIRSGSSYRIEAVAYVQPLTVDDAEEVESWLRGEIRGFGSGVLGLPRGLFGIIRDLSGLGERTSRGSSPRFGISILPSGRVRALYTSEPGEAEKISNRPDS